MLDLLGRHELQAEAQPLEIKMGSHRLVIESKAGVFLYKRFNGQNVEKQTQILSGSGKATLGVFPSPPLLTPKAIAKNVYLKFKTPIVVDQRSEALLFSKIPIEIGVFSQVKDEELLLDAFSIQKQQFALYGQPETGIVCRYKEVDVSATEQDIKPAKYEEALVRIRVRNMIDNVIKINKVIIPMDGVVLDHLHDDAQVPGNVEMNLDMAFGKDIVNVRLANTKVKRQDKTSLVKKEDTLILLMDAGY